MSLLNRPSHTCKWNNCRWEKKTLNSHLNKTFKKLLYFTSNLLLALPVNLILIIVLHTLHIPIIYAHLSHHQHHHHHHCSKEEICMHPESRPISIFICFVYVSKLTLTHLYKNWNAANVKIRLFARVCLFHVCCSNFRCGNKTKHSKTKQNSFHAFVFIMWICCVSWECAVGFQYYVILADAAQQKTKNVFRRWRQISIRNKNTTSSVHMQYSIKVRTDAIVFEFRSQHYLLFIGNLGCWLQLKYQDLWPLIITVNVHYSYSFPL